MPSELKRLKQLEEENQRLRRLVADLFLGKEMLQDVTHRKSEACVSPRVGEAPTSGLGRPHEARAIVGGSRSSRYSWHKCDTQAVLRQRIREIAETRAKWSYRRIHAAPRRINPKRVHRLYCPEGL